MNQKAADSKAVEKNKRRLRAAFVELLKTKTPDKITVSELTEKAFLSRATFYLYYADLAGFYKESVDYVFNKFAKQLIKFLADGEAAAEENCTLDNLIVDKYDCELIAICIKYLQKRGDCQRIQALHRKSTL
ncbi:MAG: hypothetical protein NC110_03630 [Ruminococcus sp.]|nr:hypothetical protein [Ruminococcus sp.]